MIYELPTSAEVQGKEYKIRSDYRAILDIIEALNDAGLTDKEKAFVILAIFYEDENVPMCEEAIKECFKFINCGTEDNGKKAPKLMDWSKDFQYIVAPVNRVIGQEIRSMEYLHWWTFISAYYEIGDCVFAQIVNIRNKKAKGKQLDKAEKEWYSQNKELVDIKVKLTEAEENLLSKWGGK